jgi:hypothetical protein
MFRDLMKPLVSSLGPRAGTPSRQLLPAPPPVALGRLYPLDVLVQLRDQAARNVAMYTRQAEQLRNPTPPITPPTLAKPAVPAVEEPSARRRSQPRSMLIGY